MKQQNEENYEEEVEKELTEEEMAEMQAQLVEKMEVFTLEEQREIEARMEPIIEEIKARYRNGKTDRVNDYLYNARHERRFSAEELAEEIFPLLEDTFEAEIEYDGEEITLEFLNGQKFRLIVKTINK